MRSAQEKMMEQEPRWMQEIINYTPGGMHVCYLNNPFYLEYASDGLCRMLGYTREEFEQVTQQSYTYHMLPEDAPRFVEFVQDLAKESKSRTMEYRLVRKDGSLIHVSDTMESKRDANGVMRGYSSVTDISEQKKLESELRCQREEYKRLYHELKVSEQRFRLAGLASGIMFFEYDLRKKMYVCVENLEKVLGSDVSEIRQYLERRGMRESIKKEHRMEGLVHPEDEETVIRAYEDFQKNGHFQVEVRLSYRENEYHWYSIKKQVIRSEDGVPEAEIGCVWNVDATHQEIDRLKQKSDRDPMSGLLNKVAAYDKINRILQMYPEQTHALIFFDLDNFKQINDTMGHDMGDRVICFVADTLRELFRNEDILARFGGDEFIVFLPNVPSEMVVCDRVQKFNQLVKACEDLKDSGIDLSASIGVAITKGELTAREVYANADQALYEAKAQGKCRYFVKV